MIVVKWIKIIFKEIIVLALLPVVGFITLRQCTKTWLQHRSMKKVAGQLANHLCADIKKRKQSFLSHLDLESESGREIYEKLVLADQQEEENLDLSNNIKKIKG